IPNANDGVRISDGAQGNAIGDLAANQISGNAVNGIELNGAMTTGNLVSGNLIGMNAANISALPNQVGILITNGATNNFIGISKNGGGTPIKGNSGTGLLINGIGTDQNNVQNNTFGTAALGNGLDAVGIEGGAKNNFIGGTAAGSGNVVDHAVRAGV